MTPDGRLDLIRQVRDVQIVDAEGVHCGIVDDLELAGAPGGPLRIKALLVGPGAYAQRLPRWWLALIQRIAGRECVHVPWEEVQSITSVVTLRRRAAELRLGRGEGRARRLLPPIGALK